MIHQTLRAGAYRKLPMHTAFWHFAMACFLGTFITDLTYWKTAEMTWANFSAWLLAAGLLLGVVAALVGLIDWLVGRLVGMHRPTLGYLVGKVIILAFSFFNAWFTAAMPGHPLCRWFWPVGCRGGPDGGNKPH